MEATQNAQRAYLRQAMAATGMDGTNLAREAKMAPSTVNKFLNSEVKHLLSARTLAKIAAVSGVPVPPAAIGAQGDNDEIAEAVIPEEQFIDPSGLPGVQKGANNLKSKPRSQRSSDSTVPEIDVRAGMGGGGESMLAYKPDSNGDAWPEDAVTGLWNLPPSYLQQELRLRPHAARIIEVQGDSMEPLLLSGDRVMVNLLDRAPSPPGVFAVWDGIGVVVKRLEFIPNSDPPCIVISSDNPKHGRYERTADEVNIIGRVVWFARRM